jgi:ribosomal protein S6--L-glutamate ligase
MKRQGAEGDFRSNLHQGGKATAHTLTKREKATALAAAKALGLGICGVDMIPSSRGSLVMEVNSSPGLEGIEKSTNIDIAGKIMDYIATNVAPKCETNTKKRKLKKDSIGA